MTLTRFFAICSRFSVGTTTPCIYTLVLSTTVHVHALFIAYFEHNNSVDQLFLVRGGFPRILFSMDDWPFQGSRFWSITAVFPTSNLFFLSARKLLY